MQTYISYLYLKLLCLLMILLCKLGRNILDLHNIILKQVCMSMKILFDYMATLNYWMANYYSNLMGLVMLLIILFVKRAWNDRIAILYKTIFHKLQANRMLMLMG